MVEPMGRLIVAIVELTTHGENNEQNLFNNLKKRTEEAAASVNSFLDEDYKALMEYLEANPELYDAVGRLSLVVGY